MVRSALAFPFGEGARGTRAEEGHQPESFLLFED